MHTSVFFAEKGDHEWDEDYQEFQVAFHHNGDYSGDVIISLPNSHAHSEIEHFSDETGDHHIASVRVPYSVIERFVMERMRNHIIEQLQEMPPGRLFEYITNGLL